MADAEQPSAAATIALLRSHSLTGVVQREIERMILSGELPAGTRLNENALANRLSVSRGPVREACRALAALGFVEIFPNRGVFIKRLGRDDAIEVYDLRAGITGLASSLLAPMLTHFHIERLDALLAEMDAAAAEADFAKFYPLNLEFHDFIVRSTGNSRLTRTYRGLVKEFHLFRSHGLVQRDALLASNQEHRAIVDALKTRDANRSYQVAFQHVANGKQRTLKALDDLAGQSPARAVADSLGTDHPPADRNVGAFE
jgi:DNA-binding GntR family transcriptional regulator